MTKPAELTAVLICPDRALAKEFSAAIGDLQALNVLAEIKEYPATTALDQRLKHLRPDALLLDVASDRETALYLLSHLRSGHAGLAVIGLHNTGDPETILLCLRSGVAEFLHAPFRLSDAEQAIMRLVGRKESDVRNQPARGRLIAFAPAKGGSGATSVASNVAHQLRRLTDKRVLLADFDLTEGTICFLFKLTHSYSLLDAIKHSHQLDESLWGSLVANRFGLDILPAPEKPYTSAVEPYRIHECLEYARSLYDFVVVDLASISEKVAVATLNEADEIHLVTSPDLPSLFLARKTLALMEEMGFHKDQVRVAVNRLNKREDLSLSDMEKIFRYPVFATFASDSHAMRRALTEGNPVAEGTDLGTAYRKFAEGLIGSTKASPKAPSAGLRSLFSEGHLVKADR
jgi:pilus assembly protein CpaE